MTPMIIIDIPKILNVFAIVLFAIYLTSAFLITHSQKSNLKVKTLEVR